MKQAIGTTQIINYIIIFIVITFCFLIATLGYMKAFKVNSKIANSIEKFEGYNDLAIKEIKKDLNTLGYKKGNANCNDDGDSIPGYNACVSLIGRSTEGKFIRYKITTFIEFGPIFGYTFKFPIKSQTEKIYVFQE